jgi:hypothetical protein
MKTIASLCMVVVSMVFYAAIVRQQFDNSFFGIRAGESITTGSLDIFIGGHAGQFNTIG